MSGGRESYCQAAGAAGWPDWSCARHTRGVKHFRPLRDPRLKRKRKHSLVNALVMARCGVVAGADGWEQVAVFAKARAEWFATFLDMPNGVPCADTFRPPPERDPRTCRAAGGSAGGGHSTCLASHRAYANCLCCGPTPGQVPRSPLPTVSRILMLRRQPALLPSLFLVEPPWPPLSDNATDARQQRPARPCEDA